MRDSLRVRLVLWYALVLALVVVSYGGAVVYQSWRSTMAGVDAELDVYAREIRNALKPVEGGRFDLELPPDAAAYFFRREGGRPYYVIWGPGGELVDQSDPEMQAGRSGTAPDGRREKSFQAAGGATVLIGRDVSRPAARRVGVGRQRRARGPRDAGGCGLRRLVRCGPGARANRSHQPDGARHVRRGSERPHRRRADRERARAGGVDAQHGVRPSAARRRAGAPLHRRCVARASHTALGSARRNGVGARSRSQHPRVQSGTDRRLARGTPDAGHRRAPARACPRRCRARRAGFRSGGDSPAYRGCGWVAGAHGSGAQRPTFSVWPAVDCARRCRTTA